MRAVVRIFYAWAPALVWMGLIFFLSSRERISVAEEQLLNFIFFKSLHVIEYAILYLLIFRAFFITAIHKSQTRSMFFSAITIAVFYAISDEVHQAFVPTREGTLRDVFIDTFGILIMYTLLKKHFSIVKKYL